MIENKLRKIKEEINEFEDNFSKYAFIAELSSYVAPKQPEIMIDDYLFKGCQSKVWLKMEEKNGECFVKATSDTLIVRGVLYIMMVLYNGEKIKDIAKADFDFLKECGIEEHFTSERTSGIKGINRRIREFCCSCCKNE